MMVALISLCAFGASWLTFFSGFGLGTILLPVFALFYPIELAVASTAVVHFLNGLFKLALVGRHADRQTVLRFGIPAIATAILGAWLLARLSDMPPLASYTVLGARAEIVPAKLVVGILLLLVTAAELTPRFASFSVPPRYLPLGGVLSGFFGGLSGMQGALRSAFLIRLGLTKEAFIGTGVAVATMIDISRLGVYSRSLIEQRSRLDLTVLTAAVLAAFAGAVLGNYLLRKLTLTVLQRIVGVALAAVGLGLATGLL